jgi:putative oxidoreductase
MFKSLAKFSDIALVVLRIGLGIIYLSFGWPKLAGGAPAWEKVGAMGMSTFGINVFPVFWGFLAALSETLGGALLILGLFFRPACIFLAVTMFVAFAALLKSSAPFGPQSSRPLELCLILLFLLCYGPGKYSADKG